MEDENYDAIVSACERIEKLAWEADGKGTPAADVLDTALRILTEVRRAIRKP